MNKPLHLLFAQWVTAQMLHISDLPPYTDPTHQEKRRAWAEQAERTLKELKDQLEIPD